MNCLVCKSTSYKQLMYIDRHSLYKCLNCGVEFIFPQPSQQELLSIYSKDYYKSWGLDKDTKNNTLRSMKIATFNERLKAIAKFKKSGTILDVGCATGYFLEAAQEQGYTPFGIEISEYSSDTAKKKFGNNAIWNGTIEDCPFPNNTFDIIAMSDLLEHVIDPNLALQKAGQLLKSGGIIMIMTPDTGSLSASIMRSSWTHYKTEHLFYFSKRSIEYILKENGFKVREIRPAKKAMNLGYFQTQFEIYRHWLLSPFVKMLSKVLPKRLESTNFYLTMGEMVVIAEKKSFGVIPAKAGI